MSDDYDESEEWTEVLPDAEPHDLYDPTLPVAYFEPLDAVAITVQTAAMVIDAVGSGVRAISVTLFAAARARRADRWEAELAKVREEERRAFDAIISPMLPLGPDPEELS